MAVATKETADFSIKPESVTPSIPTSEWPLLLKNYDQREFASSLVLSLLRRRLLRKKSTCAKLSLQYSLELATLHQFQLVAPPSREI